VINIIATRDLEENLKIAKVKKLDKENKDKAKKRQDDLDAMWRSMGKDPKKMRKVS